MFTVLVVDDDPISIALLAAQLLSIKNRGFYVALATSPSEALALVNKDVKLVISDLYMPGMNGIDLIKAIKRDYTDIKAILISAIDVMSEVSEASVDLAIQKPFHIEDLASVVELSDKSNFDAVMDRIILDLTDIKNSLAH